MYPYERPYCKAPDTTYHLVWAGTYQPNPIFSPSPERRECELTSCLLPETQVNLLYPAQGRLPRLAAFRTREATHNSICRSKKKKKKTIC